MENYPIRVPTPDLEVRADLCFSDKEVQQQNDHPVRVPTPNLEAMLEFPRMEANGVVIELIPKPAPDALDPLTFSCLQKTATLGIMMFMSVSTSPSMVHNVADTHRIGTSFPPTLCGPYFPLSPILEMNTTCLIPSLNGLS